MSARLNISRDVVDGAAGETIVVRCVLHNEGASPATFTVRMLGFESASLTQQPFVVHIPAAASTPCDIPVTLPLSLPTGHHAAAFEVSSDRDQHRQLTPFSIAVASVERVVIEPTPSPVRGRRRAKMRIDLTNNEPAPVTFTLLGEANGVRVRFRQDDFELQPGEHAVTKAKIKGPRHWVGEKTQHNLLLSARGRSSTASVTAPFVQRPLFARRLRMLVAGLAVIALWLGAIGGTALWWTNRNNADDQQVASGPGIDADGDGLIDPLLDAAGNPITGTGGTAATIGSGVDADGDGFFDPLLDAVGNPIPGTGGAATSLGSGQDADGDGFFDPMLDANGNPIPGTGGGSVAGAGGGAGPDSGVDLVSLTTPTSTVIRGTLTLDGSDDISAVSIRLAPIALGAQPPQLQAFRAATPEPDTTATRPVKIWSARKGVAPRTLNPVRQSEPLAPRDASVTADGIWLFSDVPLRQSYEVVFANPGYDTQSFVVTPQNDGTPIDLDVELVPAIGAISGVVQGPNGALGGVTIGVTDGTLTFDTTSATDGSIGTFALDALSTPGVYTVTASLRGYGTEVQQVRLGEGQTISNVSIAMVRDVGAIGGQAVDDRGNPLGGVTITATNGSNTRVTTSLTEGAIGSFNLPQLTVPSTYTVTAELAGFVTQTRRLVLGGSIGGVNFSMIAESLSLEGRVTSGSDGKGIVSASVILTRDDLKFRVSTSAGPFVGSFVVDDLPPGSYVVTIEHFRHKTFNQLITIEAGVQPPPINVELEPTNGVADIGTGTVIVEVVDDQADDASKREITGSTIVLTRTLTGVAQTFEADTFTFAISNLQLGTYTLVVSAPGYNISAPRQVSLGIPVITETVALIKLGAAQGAVVDALDSSIVLSGYQVSMTQIRENGERIPLDGRVASVGNSWATQPDELEIGTWEALIRDDFAPEGYAVRNTQTLDPAAGGPMRFIIPPESVDPVQVTPIEAVPYPNIGGRVLQPKLIGGNTVFEPIDSASLTVTVTCTNGIGGPFTGAVLTDDLGSTNSQKNLFDTFFIDKSFTDGSELTGDCSLLVTAAGFVDRTVPLSNVRISDGITASDRFVNIALNKAVGDFGGRAYWIDKFDNSEVPIINTNVVATAATVDFTASDDRTQLGTSPSILQDTVRQTTLDPTGFWQFEDLPTFNDQLFGIATYDFDAVGFDDARFDLTIDQTGPKVGNFVGVNVDQSGGIANLGVELTPLLPTAISGTINIVTTDITNRDYTRVTAVATSPTGTTPTLTGPTASNGNFSYSAARPGTWEVDFTAPPNHQFRTPNFHQERVLPAIPLDTFDSELIELGLVDLHIVDAVTSADINSGATITLVPRTAGITAPSPTVAASSTNGRYQQLLIHVLGTSAVDTVTYDIQVKIPRFDTATATVFIDGTATPVVSTGNDLFLTIPNRAFLAGTKDRLEIRVRPLGSRTGTVLGVGAGSATTPLGSSGTVTATRLFGVGGNALTGQPVLPVVFDLVGAPANGVFSISGPPGYYELAFAYPDYENQPSAPVPASDWPFLTPVPSQPLYLIQNGANTAIPGNFLLPVRNGSLDLTVVTALTSGMPVTTATYELSSSSSTRSGSVGGTGEIVVTDLIPDNYTLTVRSFDVLTGVENAFPTIVDIPIRSLTINNTEPTYVVAPLPPLAPNLVGTVRALNSNNVEVNLPLTTRIDIDIDEPQVLVNDPGVPGSTLVANTSGDTFTTIVVDATSTTNPPAYNYVFASPPVGVHPVTANPVDGYETPSPDTQLATVIAAGHNPAPDFIYRVLDTSVRVQLSPSGSGELYDLTGMTVTLSSLNATYTGFSFDAATSIITIPNVAPEVDDFSLTIDDALHEAVTLTPVSVPVDIDRDPTNNTLVNFPTTADLGRVTGRALQNSGSGPGPLLAGGTVTFTPTSPAGAAFTVGHNSSTGNFTDDIDPGVYDITVENIGFITSAAVSVTVVAGKVTTVTVPTIVKLATLSINIANANDVALPVLRVVNNSTNAVVANATKSGITFTATVPAGSYRLEFSGTDYSVIRIGSPFVLGIGEDRTLSSFTLPRKLVVNVSGPNDATVTVFYSGTTVLLARTDSTTSPFVFRSDDVAPKIPATAGFTIEVSATGNYTTQSFAVAPYVAENVGTLGKSIGVTLQRNPLLTLQGSLTFPGSGPITFMPFGAGIIATAEDDNSVTIAGTLTTTAGGTTYRIGNLTTKDDGENRTWNIVFNGAGVGVGATTTLLVNKNSPTPPSTPIVVTPQNVDVTFNISSSSAQPPNDLAGAVVTVTRTNGANITSAALASSETFAIVSIPENSTGVAWTVSGVTYHGSDSGTLLTFPTRTAPAAQNVVVTPQNVVVTFSISSSSTEPPNDLAGAVVTVTRTNGANITSTALAVGETSATVSIPANSTGVMWSVAGAANHVPSTSYSLGTFPTITAPAPSVTLQSTAIRGTVTTANAAADGFDPVAGASVVLCRVVTPGPGCTYVDTFTSNDDGEFFFNEQPEGSYEVNASGIIGDETSPRTKQTTFTVAANGVPSPATLSVVLEV